MDKTEKKHYYVLHCQTLKTEKICTKLNRKKQIKAFIPKMEKYIRIKDIIVLQIMFPGYLFIETSMNQIEFDSFLYMIKEEHDGIIKELKKDDVTALSLHEIDLLDKLLDSHAILRMSEGYKKNGRTIVISGPLLQFQDLIIDTNKRDMIAILNINFLDRNIKAGMRFK